MRAIWYRAPIKTSRRSIFRVPSVVLFLVEGVKSISYMYYWRIPSPRPPSCGFLEVTYR